MDAFELLKADHQKVAELFDRLEAASGEAKLNIFKQINSELDVHAHIEEKVFYPALEKPEETHDLTLEAYEEHKLVKTLLAELSNAQTADDEWEAKAKVLRENVEHHVEEEENELFDKAAEALSPAEIEELGNRMAAEKSRQQGVPGPKRTRAKSTREKSSKAEPGILSKIADFVGLGSGTTEKKTAKSRAKKSGARKGQKLGTKRAAKKSGGKSASAAPTKRSAKGKGSKRAVTSKSAKSAGKKGGSRSAKKATKK